MVDVKIKATKTFAGKYLSINVTIKIDNQIRFWKITDRLEYSRVHFGSIDFFFSLVYSGCNLDLWNALLMKFQVDDVFVGTLFGWYNFGLV